jgi:Rrf2 family protein
MLFSAKAEYACLAVLELAARYGDTRPVRLTDIADKHGIPQRFLVQILLQLKGAGLIASTRGAAGGYQLAKSPEQISIQDVVGVIDPRDRPTRARRDGKQAKINSMPATSGVSTVRSVWKEIEHAQRVILEQTSFADLVQRTEAHQDHVYQI